MKKLGNYKWSFCKKHGRYVVTSKSGHTCPKCLKKL